MDKSTQDPSYDSTTKKKKKRNGINIWQVDIYEMGVGTNFDVDAIFLVGLKALPIQFWYVFNDFLIFIWIYPTS